MASGARRDLDFLDARLHGRRSRMAEGERLAALCRLPGLAELVRAVAPGADLPAAGDWQRWLQRTLAREIRGLPAARARRGRGPRGVVAGGP